MNQIPNLLCKLPCVTIYFRNKTTLLLEWLDRNADPVHVLGRVDEPGALCGVRRGTGDHERMRLAEPRLREVQVHEDELAAGSSLLHDEFQVTFHSFAAFRQVFDELALAVHMDVNRVCLRVETETVVAVLLLDALGDNPLEVVFTEMRKRQGDDNGFLHGTHNREI